MRAFSAWLSLTDHPARASFLQEQQPCILLLMNNSRATNLRSNFKMLSPHDVMFYSSITKVMPCSSVLSIPYAWSRLGVLCGLLTQIVVALCNAVASVLLLRTAAKVKQSTYENVAEAVGGPIWRIITQVTLQIYKHSGTQEMPSACSSHLTSRTDCPSAVNTAQGVGHFHLCSLHEAFSSTCIYLSANHRYTQQVPK